MIHAISVSMYLVLLGLLIVAASPAVAAADDDLAARLKAVPPTHPRLFFTEAEEEALKAKIKGDTLLTAAYGHLLAGANGIQDLEPVVRVKTGRRLLGVSRNCLHRVSYLAFAYRMTKDEAYAKRAEREMLSAAAFEDWNPSHFLDVGEMTAALGIGYDWLYNELDPEARATIRDAIVEKGLRTSMKGGWWVGTTNNWNQVCHGGLVTGALAVLEDEPELAEQVIARAIANVPKAMHEYEPDGVYPEGPSYWKYGTTYNVILISALESVVGSDFGLASAGGFMKTPEFYLHATGPTGLFYNFSDCGTRGGIATAMHWFAARAEDPSLLWREKAELELFAAQKPKAGAYGNRTLPFLLMWARPIDDVPAPQQLHWKGDGRTPVAMLRSGWDENATFVGIKGGSPGSNHAHMDIGSFVLDMDGMRWGIDLGAQGYHSLESKGIGLWGKDQDSERWTVFRLNNMSHSTLVVDGQLQRVKGKAPIVGFSDEPAAPFAVVDMTPVYEGQLAQAHRGARLVGECVLIQDEVKTLDKTSSIRWGMVTNAEVAVSGNAARLKQSGRSVTVRVLSPADATLKVYDMENPPRDYDAKNPNTRMVGFEVEVAASSVETLVVFVEPGGKAGEVPGLKALSDW